jgi:basic membrane protein A
MRHGPTIATLGLLALGFALTFLPARKEPRGSEARGPKRSARARVGLVFDVGGRGDKSFNDAAYAGLVRAERELDVETSFLEPVGSEDREAALRLFASRGLDLVIGVGFIFSSDVDAVARSYPNVHFACIDYFPPNEGPPANVAGLAFHEEEGSFLVGAVAGLVTKTRHVGFVGGMTGPLIRKFEVGYATGEGGVPGVRRPQRVRGRLAGRVQGSREGQGADDRRDRGGRGRALPRVGRVRARGLRRSPRRAGDGDRRRRGSV